MERLGRQLVTTPPRPTRIIQFGEGNFLRAFVDWLVDCGVAIVQPLPTGQVGALEAQDRLYTVLLEGIQDGKPVREHRVIDVVNQTVNPYTDWDAFLALAHNADTTVIVSNTTEAGIAIDPADAAGTVPPRGFPAKLAYLLAQRFQVGLPGFLILPCELIDDSGPRLKQCVLQCVRDFNLGDDLAAWIDTENTFCSTLVDRIVSGYPAGQADALCQEFGYDDALIVKAEPFISWVIEGTPTQLARLPLPAFAVTMTDNLRPYRDRKVYLLNGPHTTMAQLARLAGFSTVGDVMSDPAWRAFIEAEMCDEISPVIDLPQPELALFATQTIERFDNPTLHHSLDAIALNSVSKFTARLLPIIKANLAAGRPLPQRIALALAGLLAIYGRLVHDAAHPIDSPDIIDAFQHTEDDYVATVLANEALWGEDLTKLDDLTQTVTTFLATITTSGVRAAIGSLS